MTNLEVRTFAYDVVAKYLIDEHNDFAQAFYNSMRQGGTICHAIDDFMRSRRSDLVGVDVRDFAAQFVAKSSFSSSTKCKVVARVCDIIADNLGVVSVITESSFWKIMSKRDNLTLGFIDKEECANMIVDILKDECCSPSIHLIDSLFKQIGLPRFVDCVDNSTLYLTR